MDRLHCSSRILCGKCLISSSSSSSFPLHSILPLKAKNIVTLMSSLGTFFSISRCPVVYTIALCMSEMATFLPISSPFVRFAGRFVDPAFGVAAGYNFFLFQASLCKLIKRNRKRKGKEKRKTKKKEKIRQLSSLKYRGKSADKRATTSAF